MMNLHLFLSATVTFFCFYQAFGWNVKPPSGFNVDASICSSTKLQFNGIFNCTEGSNAFNCTISCPEGSEFEFPPAPVYTCRYAEAKFLPEFVPQCLFGSDLNDPLQKEYERIKRDLEFNNKNVMIENEIRPGSCFMWGGSHVKTFDGEVFSFSSPCAHTLVRDEVDETFSIVIQDSQECLNELENCYSVIKIYLQDEEYVLKRSAQGMPIFMTENKVLPLPGYLPGIRAEMFGHYIVILIDSIGLRIKWNGAQMVQVNAQEGLWNKTAGLCGKLDGDRSGDLLTKYNTKSKNIISLVSSWQIDTLGNECKDVPVDKHKCHNPKLKNKRKQAIEICKKMISDKRFAPCQTVMDIRMLFDTCIWDYCSCHHSDPKQCSCETLNVYVRECTQKGVTALTKWRDEQMCPLECTGGRIYMPCAPSEGQTNCGDVTEIFDEDAECEEGCYCPERTVLHNSRCMPVSDCPCWYHGKDYPSGSTVPKDCNTCTCVDGKWDCTKKSCNVRCTVAGDPHYTTFDGKRYDFMGTCSYYLVQHENFTIEAENLPCGAAGVQGRFPACARTVTVRTAGHAIKLKQNREILVNGQESQTLPFYVGGATVRAGSSNFIIITLQNGVEIWWDSTHTAYIDIPPSCKRNVKGLCGTFSLSQKDDFLTPEGDIEESAAAFANKWKTSEKCDDVPDEVAVHPCTVNVQNKPSAEKHCGIIKSDLFADCHKDVDSEPFYQDCTYDMCSCNEELTKCLCPMIAAYARECALKGKQVEWTNSIGECAVKCPNGQINKICGNSCARSCYDIATLLDCQPQCVEGCNCPQGEALDDNGECVLISQCSCQYEGLSFPAGYKQVRPSSKAPVLCTCVNAQWTCHKASSKELREHPNINDLKARCSAAENKEFTTCEPAEPITCKNMHAPELVTTAVCHAGCQCKKGYVLDTFSKICVKPTECRCHHSGRSYHENVTVQNDCNICTCIHGKWECTQKVCPAECTAWGDSHYKTFDGKFYDYQGQCDYILTKGTVGNDRSFDISIQNVPCGTLGVSCSKSITIRVGSPPNQESITFTREKEIPKHATLKQLIVRQKGHFVIVEAPELGLIVRWDKGTRVYVKLDPQWKNRVKGLCGNYNDNQLDDFQTPSGGITEVSALLFGDSWRLQPYCLKALDISDTCEQRPDRKVWALKKCGILKSSVFANCHSEVPVETYLDRCIFDTCACDQGGDCECLCTALAAYAQECNNKGIPIKWRTPELCPMQCDERCAQYSPCVSTCPTETCDNMLIHGQLSTMCDRDACIEGCQVKPCPIGFIYSNSSHLECVPRKSCLPLCLEINGKTYYEGDLIEEDPCHSCYCSRGKKICQGLPCATTTTPAPIPQGIEKVQCVSGWTAWINQDAHLYVKYTDVEPLPDSLRMNNLVGKSHCGIQNMVDIECRTVLEHTPAKQTGLDVECSLERGLLCNSSKAGEPCLDFEIRVKCQCEAAEEEEVEQTTTEAEFATKPYKVVCPPGEEYQDCAIECHHLCIYYSHVLKQSGHCRGKTECEAGCVSAKKQLSCLPGMFWANNETCVVQRDCMCLSHSGEPVKPGVMIKESECKVCQCVDNYYACDESACATTIVPELLENKNVTVPVFVVSSTVTPPSECNKEDFISLIDGDVPLFDEAFSASSASSKAFAPKYGRLSSTNTGTSGGSWMPESLDNAQYLQINLPNQEPVYGVIIKGSPTDDEYVTSYKVMYSPDGHTFSYVATHNKQPQIFRGSVDGNTPIKQIFDVPVEAQIIRINPQTWHKGIALRVELIGCRKFVTTTVPIVRPKYCVDPMGVNDGMMADQQISVSSERDQQHGKNRLKIDGMFAWQPVTNSPSEWVQFDFLEPRNITGLVTKGGRHGWITVYNIKYSHDGKEWNPVLDNQGNERTFLGNINENTPQVTNFDLPIRTKLLKIIPTKWHQNIQLRIEPHGCFIPYPELVYTTTEAPSICNSCPGSPTAELEMGACQCKENLWWDGENCVERSQCPCIVGHIPYAVQTTFENEDCAQCLCKFGGIVHCTPKSCPKCEKDQRSVVTIACGCTCQPCESGTVLCPTSNICINSTDWCDGVKDCPDDETDCVVEPEILTTTETPEKIKKLKKKPTKKCKAPTCTPGYKVVMKQATEAESGWDRKTIFTTHSRKGGVKGGRKTVTKIDAHEIIRPKETTKEHECPLFDCILTKPAPVFPGATEEPCPEVSCPEGYMLEVYPPDQKEFEACVSYECKAPLEQDAVCNVTGRTFNTFDKTEFKYDICNHILVRDLEDQHWEISLKKNCTTVCSRDLIVHHEDHVFVFHPDLSIEYDGYQYTIDHTKKIGSHSNLFAISQLGEALVFVSNKYGFWVIWDKEGNMKIGISRKLFEQVDGLCGYFNDETKDDKRKPDKNFAKTTAEFGSSWARPDQSVICEAKACPLHIQNKAWEMCNLVKEETFASCSKVVDVDAFVSRCLEITCTCLEVALDNKEVEEKCRCSALQRFVVDCSTANSNLEIIDWRMKHGCPVDCEAPLVHHDCYRRRCEPSCGSLNSNVCPKLDHVCFPGCYCPPGYVRKGEDCVLPTNCGDCECNVLPHLEYVTYDEQNFTINGNCTYIMSQDVLNEKDGKHKFKVLITNEACEGASYKMCVGKVTILYKGHKMHIARDLYNKKLKFSVDSKLVHFADIEWAHIKQDQTKHLRILLHEIQIHISVYYPSLGVSIKAPSLNYGGKLEGLCGDCNDNPDNDLSTPDVDKFGLSWLYGDYTPEQCMNQPEEICKEVPTDVDPCMQLENAAKYQQCNPVLSPGMFIEWCKKDTCNGHPELSCAAIEAYSLECGHLGFCIDWRTDLCPAKHCPADQEYKACAPACSQTCEVLKNKEQKCMDPPIEGCFCSEGKVFLNNTCVAQDRCEACDDEGHRSGDNWQKDVCTTCICEGTSVKCETQKCPDVETVCEDGFNMEKIRAVNQCCDKYICVQVPTTTSVSIPCEPPQQLSCSLGQIMKLIKKADGCQQFVCECKPVEECEPIDSELLKSSEPGIVKEVDETGCCPVVTEMCKMDLCPKPPVCPQFHTVEKTSGKCCPKYTCARPKDKCIFELQYIAGEKGGERLRNEQEKHQVLKEANEKWHDGPCRECKCTTTPTGDYYDICTITECPALTEATDQDYILEANPIVGQCCPNIKKVACKHTEKIYKVGQKWSPEGDYCTTIECTENSLGIQKLTQTTTCETACELGWKYVPATADSKKCCGSCKAVACVVDGVAYEDGEEWTSSDRCTNYYCSSLNGSMQVQSIVVNCPEVSGDLLKDYVVEIIPVEGECCRSQKVVACRVGNKKYEIGETWLSPNGDKCKKITCSKTASGEIVKQESVETCNMNCSKGWEYKYSESNCCGECIQTSCVVNNELKNPGTNWTSPDGCITYMCDVVGDQFMVITQQESCPNVDKCPPEEIYSVGCCKHCNITSRAQVQCILEELNPDDTIGLVSTIRPPHGRCVNKEGLKGFMECSGTCKSYTRFNTESGRHDSVCKCCQVTKYQPYVAHVECDDGYSFKKQVAIPSQCGCKECYSENESVGSGNVEPQ